MSELLSKNASLAENVSQWVTRYLEHASTDVIDLHQMVIEQIEPPLFKTVIEQHKYNQTRAAKALGISRSTLRRLLVKYFDERYCGSRPNNEAL